MQVSKQYTLYANVDILKAAPAGFSLVLVDTPGFGEANMDHITELAKTLFNTSSAYLYVMDITQMGDITDSQYLKQLSQRDEGKLLCNLHYVV